MSSHREAPEISKDPVADSTDVYAFVSPDQPGTVTLIANYIPLQAPDGGPNFYEFADDVLYEIHIDNTGDGNPDISYQFRFTTVNNIPSSFLYNDGPITSLTPPSPSSNWNRQQTYTLTRVDNNPANRWRNESIVLGSGLLCPPCNIGPLSTPNYAALAERRRSTPSEPDRSRPRCSPASGRRASTSTWVPSSTSAIFDPSPGTTRAAPPPAS